MKSKTNAKKLEFKKQTLARLDEDVMMNVKGGDPGGQQSVFNREQCNLTLLTRNRICNTTR